MKEAHDLIELKNLISQLGLKDERRQSARYTVDIVGNYHADHEKSAGPSGECRLVDVSKEGLSVQLSAASVRAGAILHLELPQGGSKVDIATRVVYVEAGGGCCIVGLQSTGERDDIIQQLFSSSACRSTNGR
jgi:hypothetical protein